VPQATQDDPGTPRTPPLDQSIDRKLTPADEFDERHTACKSGTVVILNTKTHEVTFINARCRRWRCPICGPVLRVVWTNRIADAKPERFITLTCDTKRFPTPGHAYDAMKEALPKLVAKLRKLCGRFEYCAIWELHESGYPHLHLAHRGDYVPKHLLSETWNRLGIGYIVDIRAITDRRQAAVYASKYITKTIAEMKQSIQLTKVVQYSKHFFPPELMLKKPRLDDNTVCCYMKIKLRHILEKLLKWWRYVVLSDEANVGVRCAWDPTGNFLEHIDLLCLEVPP